MPIEEMKAKGFKRYSAYIKKLIYTEEIEVWARNIEDAYKIFECSADEIFDSCFADREYTEVLGLAECEGDLPKKLTDKGRSLVVTKIFTKARRNKQWNLTNREYTPCLMRMSYRLGVSVFLLIR